MYDAASGILLRRYRAGDAAIPGFLDDYAFFTQALVDLYETGFIFGRANFHPANVLRGRGRQRCQEHKPAGRKNLRRFVPWLARLLFAFHAGELTR